MAEMMSTDDQVPFPAVTTSVTSDITIPSTKESVDTATSTNAGSVSPKLQIPRIFSRTKSVSSHHSHSKDDSDENSQSFSESEKEKKKEKGDKWQFFGTPKPKSSSGWMNLPFAFTMSHREKNQEIHKIFGQLPTSEKLIDDFSCALQRDILVHGRLYVTQNWLCFYANIFAWETLLTVPFRTVVSITKERTAILIPNAIQLSTTVEKYGFSSFVQRDQTYNILFKVWQNSQLDSPLPPIDLVKAARKAWGDSTDVGSEEDLWGGVSSHNSSKSNSPKAHRHSMPTHLEIGQVSELPRSSHATSTGEGKRKPQRPPPLVAVAKSMSAVETVNSTSSVTMAAPDEATPKGSKANNVINKDHQDGGDDTSTGPSMSSSNEANRSSRIKDGVSDTLSQEKPPTGHDGGIGKSEADNSSGEFEAYDFPDQGEIPCGCSEHTGRTILNDIYNAEVEKIFQLLFTDSDFYRSFLKSRKTTNIEISEWSTQGDNTRLRDISYTLSLNYSFGPKFTSCTEHQVYFKNGQPGVKHIVQTDAINGNVPYGDAFYVSCRFCMTRVAHNKTRLRVTSNICFRKNCWGVVKNLIERNAGDGVRSYYGHLDTALKEYLASLPAKRLQKAKRSSRRRHRRMSSVPKEEEVPLAGSSITANTSSSALRKRGGSVSSKLSLKSSDNNNINAPSEEDVKGSNKTDKQITSLADRFQSLPKVNLALTILLGLLVVFNMILYRQLMVYQSTSPQSLIPSSTSSSSSIDNVMDPLEWPDSPEEWRNLFKEYWRHDREEKHRLSDVLQDVVNTLKQMEKAISTTSSHIQAMSDSYKAGTNTRNNRNKKS